MHYAEETQARNLYEALSQTFLDSSPETEILIEGAGVHWLCRAARNGHMCVIDCFGRSEYAVSFQTNAVTEANGRTRQEEELIEAVRGWLQGQNLSELYRAFAFVDREKRFLEKFLEETLLAYPELSQRATAKLDHGFIEFYQLWLSAQDRSSCVYFWGQDRFLHCEFCWDSPRLFELQAEATTQLPLLLKRWLCDYAMPSALEQEFTWLDTGRLAKYYEQGRGIEGEFVLSWDSIEAFYRETARLPQSSAILNLIAQMREKGYDRTLRAGTSMYTLILSRARRHGWLTTSILAFEFCKDGMDVYRELGGEAKPKLSSPKIEYLPELEVLLEQLEAENIGEPLDGAPV